MLREKIQENLTLALKNKDMETLSVLRFLMSGIKNKEIEKGTILPDEDVIQVIKKQIKELESANEMFNSAGRTELTENNKKQITILSQYLPAELTDEELVAEIKNIITNNQEQYAKNPKSMMGICVGALRAKADPQRIIKVLKEL
ncbi:MAG TPA: GatB/YqeY domain-containing protein [Candidatus Nitrosocosmicus sp.]|nr:GatB/YqeY domain-containing protein [Candidatus Nitrosocosmicus sp.]